MKTPSSSWHALLTALAVVSCSHSDPFLTDPSLVEGPHNSTPPARLTYSVEDDGWPSVSGDFLSYRFERGSADRDFCAGVLPAAGGQRIAEVCAWEQGQHTRSDDFRSLVLLADNTMAFTWHSSTTGNQSPRQGGLYVGEVGRPQDAVKVLDLLARPAGASANWTYLVDPVQLEDKAFLVLATSVFIGQLIPFGPIDTVYRGVEIAKIDVSTRPATVTSLVLATDAIAWAYDRAASMLYYHRRYYTATLGAGPVRIEADTVFRVPLAGGQPVAVYGHAPQPPGMIAWGMNGFALANGRLFVSRYSTRPLPTPPGGSPLPPETESTIAELQGDGTLLHHHTLVSSASNQWGRLFATATGSHLVAEARIGNSKDLYLIEIDP